ncbi:two-component system sensor histidine kinase DesK [Microbacterium sp. SLBN-111]
MARVSTPAARTAYARDVSATWWYTASSILFFVVLGLMLWAVPVVLEPAPLAVTAYALGVAGTLAASVLLLVRYRREPVEDDNASRMPWLLVLVGIASAVLLGFGAGSVILGTCFAASVVCLVRWRNGIRIRLVALLLVVIVTVWYVESVHLSGDRGGNQTFGLVLFVAVHPALTAASLWWWDIVRELDRARRAEGKLAAAQERLRLASDLHDLQGHHLQVIALQLELAEKMMTRDPDAAVAQVRAARASVDDARRGTRDLAARFRGVPLPDELANAADLLRAAGLAVDLFVDSEADRAPADVLGPVVREATTNVLKHGGGVSASLSLIRTAETWVLVVENDAPAEASPGSGGAGLSGIAERVGAVGGTMDATRLDDRFLLSVRIPEEGAA